MTNVTFGVRRENGEYPVLLNGNEIGWVFKNFNDCWSIGFQPAGPYARYGLRTRRYAADMLVSLVRPSSVS